MSVEGGVSPTPHSSGNTFRKVLFVTLGVTLLHSTIRPPTYVGGLSRVSSFTPSWSNTNGGGRYE